MISPKKISKWATHFRDRSFRSCSLLQIKLSASICLWWLLLTTVTNSDHYGETGGSKPDHIWTWHWYYTSKISGPWFFINNWDWTYPWPIFSNRVYFFLGSPTLTMLPERNKMQDCHFKTEIPPSSRSEMQPHCLGLWAICGQLGNNNNSNNRGSSTAQMELHKHWFSTVI